MTDWTPCYSRFATKLLMIIIERCCVQERKEKKKEKRNRNLRERYSTETTNNYPVFSGARGTFTISLSYLAP